ncbi:MAG: S1 RNA-binding domain-containing protein, partial [Clostridiales bacterium]|nr:S1 RNA-binding domain-containing protein [Clostridiales bacterium]
MELEVGAILDGKVTGITKFGAFVALPGGRFGLVHISEIAYSYVSDVSEFLSVGQDVRVKLISIDEGGRINLSTKKTAPPPPRPPHPAGPRPQGGRPASPPRQGGGRPRSEGGSAPRSVPSQGRGQYRGHDREQEPQSFDDMVKHFLSESESRKSDLNRGGESRRPRR